MREVGQGPIEFDRIYRKVDKRNVEETRDEKENPIYRALVSALVGVLALTACASTAAAQGPTGQTPAAELSEVDAEGILFMREEEKLARDVYLVLGEQWQMQVFSNIASSESTHMEAVKGLIDHYGLSDPTDGKEIGEFANVDLQALYDQLVAQGSKSLVDALRVGAAIEEIDILDLEERIAQTDKADIQVVYDNLTRGSRNHLRAFVANLERQGVAYEPAYLSPEQFEDILSWTWSRAAVPGAGAIAAAKMIKAAEGAVAGRGDQGGGRGQRGQGGRGQGDRDGECL